MSQARRSRIALDEERALGGADEEDGSGHRGAPPWFRVWAAKDTDCDRRRSSTGVLTLERLQGLGSRHGTPPETGFLVIADLTGYTAYLAQSELEHAPTIAGDLLETIVGRLDPPFRLAKFEGDAAFLFVEDGRADGSLLLDAVEASYLAFRRRLRSIDQATSCDCNSCRLAPRLDLKLFVHHGSYVRTTIAGRDELAGSDVIVVHRLLKGATAAAASRANGFALFTAAAVDALGLDPAPLGSPRPPRRSSTSGRDDVHRWTSRRWAVERQARRLDVGDPTASSTSRRSCRPSPRSSGRT